MTRRRPVPETVRLPRRRRRQLPGSARPSCAPRPASLGWTVHGGPSSRTTWPRTAAASRQRVQAAAGDRPGRRAADAPRPTGLPGAAAGWHRSSPTWGRRGQRSARRGPRPGGPRPPQHRGPDRRRGRVRRARAVAERQPHAHQRGQQRPARDGPGHGHDGGQVQRRHLAAGDRRAGALAGQSYQGGRRPFGYRPTRTPRSTARRCSSWRPRPR